MNTTRILAFIVFATTLALLLPATVHAVNMQITRITIDGQQIDPSGENSTDYLEVQRGQDLPITVRVQALADVTNAQVEANIFGYRYSANDENKVFDISPTFDLGDNGYTFKTLKLQVPTLIDKTYFKLRIRVADENSVSFEQVYNLRVVGVDAAHAVEIHDFSFSPQQVMSGRAFTAQVQVRNIGDHDLQDLKAVVSIPELNVQDTEYLTNLDQEKTKTFEKLLLRIPECAKPGTYNVDIEVDFDNYESTTTTDQITIVADPACNGGAGTDTSGQGNQGNTIVRVPGAQDVTPGQTAVYPIMIQNTGTVPRSYVISVAGAAFGTTRIDPGSLVVVNGGDTKTAYIYLSVNADAAAGQKVFAVTVDSNGDTKQIPLTANVVAGTSGQPGTASPVSLDGLKRGLEIGFIILVIVLIVIGIVLGFTRLKDPKKGTGSGQNESEPYY